MVSSASSNTTQVIATFEVKPRPDADLEEVFRLQKDLHKIARSTPTIGNIEESSWTGEDGSVLIVFIFKSMDALTEFVRLPEHVVAMKRANEFFTSVKTRIATVEKQSEAPLDP